MVEKRFDVLLFLRYEHWMDLDVLHWVRLVHATQQQQITLFVINHLNEKGMRDTY